MELNKETWIKIREEYWDSIQDKDESYILFICSFSRTFRFFWLHDKFVIINLAEEFLLTQPEGYKTGTNTLFMRELSTTKTHTQIRKEFIEWVINNKY